MTGRGERHTTGWYLYGLIDTRPAPVLDDVQYLPVRDLTALIGEVTLEEFDEAKLKERLNDPKWLERKLLKHQAVLDRALKSAATVIPMKFATIFRSQASLVRPLEAQYGPIHELAKKLQQKHEYGLKLFWNRSLAEAEVEQTHPSIQALKTQLAGQPEGTAYLLRKQFMKLLGEEAEKRLNQDLQTIYERLGAISEERQVSSTVAEHVVKHEAEVVLNVALLVSANRRDELLRAVAKLQQAFAPRGYTVKLVGPFPPYHFSQLPDLHAAPDTDAQPSGRSTAQEHVG